MKWKLWCLKRRANYTICHIASLLFVYCAFFYEIQKPKLFRVSRISFIIALMFVAMSMNTIGQNKRWNKWYFGSKAGIDFNSGAAVALTDGQMSAFEGCASIADSMGNLLFYTDGLSIWNKKHTIMPNGTGLLGNGSSTQSGIIVPHPTNNDVYYVFTVDDVAGPDGLCYSIVDMTLQGGDGDVTTKNVLLKTPVSEKITGIIHGNGKEYWVVAHESGSDAFLAYNISSTGVNTTPVISNVGAAHGGGFSTIGYMKSSHNGSKIVVVINDANGFQLFDFDNNTGIVSNSQGITGYQYPYGAEFSPDDSRLYISCTINYTASENALWQFDMTAANIKASAIKLDGGSPPRYGALQLAPDGKIYLAMLGSGNLGVINDPDSLGTKCNYVANGFSLNGKGSQLGLPNFIQSFYSKPLSIKTTSIDVKCGGDSSGTASVTTSGGTPPFSYLWTPSGQTTATAVNLKAGTYVVQVKDGGGNISYDTIIVNEPPELTVKPSPYTTICIGTSVSLYADVLGGTPVYSYNWNSGAAASQNYSVSPLTTTIYTVTVTDINGCSKTDTTSIKVIPGITVNPTPDTTICHGTSIVLKATGGNNYSWQPTTSLSNPGIANPVATPTVTTVYTVTASVGGCPPDTDSITVNVFNVIAQASNDTTICRGEKVTLMASGGSVYSWTPITGLSNTTTATVLAQPIFTTKYVVTVSDPGCTADKDTVTVNVTPSPTANAGADITVNIENTATLNASGGVTYSWLPANNLSCYDCPSPVFDPSDTIEYTYTLKVMDSNGCSSYDTITITVDFVCAEVFVPSAFSPNKDGNNDVLYVRGGFCIKEMKFLIFDRWGEVVFQTLDPYEGWKGEFRNNDANSAVYHYSLNATMLDGTEVFKKGNITLVR